MLKLTVRGWLFFGSAFDKLISNRILSIPIFDENDLFHSFVDILDIVKFALSILPTS